MKHLGRGLIAAYSIALLLFLLLPVVVIIPASFGGSELLDFPPKNLTLRWYASLATDTAWGASAWVSVQIAVGTALLTTAVSLMIGIVQLRWGHVPAWLRLMIMLPLLIPTVIIATGLFTLLLPLGALGQIWPLILVNTATALPMSVLLVLAAFQAIDPLLWTAAASMGARPLYILRVVVVPVVGTSVATAAILAFYNAWDETTFAIFIGPNVTPPLPSRLYAFLQQNVTPQVAAVSTLLLVFTLLGALLLLGLHMLRSRALSRMQAREVERRSLFETLQAARK